MWNEMYCVAFYKTPGNNVFVTGTTNYRSTTVQIHSSSAADIAAQTAFDNKNKSSSDDKSGSGGGGPSSASPASTAL